MGLTLNTNSLAVASSGSSSAASGVSTSDVTTLIKNNTPYQFISKVYIPASVSTIDCSSVFSASDGFSTYHIVFDRITTAANESYFQIRLEIGGSFITSEYGYSGARGYGNNNFYYETSDSRWRVTNSDFSQGLTGYINISKTESGVKTISSWNIGGGGGTRNGTFSVGAGSNSNTGECTGFQFKTASNDFTAGGNIRIYGVNNV
tara:strand:+ start:8095 stop:8709 length:615 start_codon:yes stop_codon:yes gene_type:complete